MPREIDPTLLAVLGSGECWPVTLMQITFRSQTEYVWSGVGTLVWNGNNFIGVGSLGSVGDVRESSEVQADGSSVSLSGVDPTMLGEALNDMRVGAPALRWLGAVLPGTATLVGTPYPLFVGQVDKAAVGTGVLERTITLALESKLINHGRASNARYTAADQHARGFPDDTGFNSVELQNDIAELWGAS